MGIVETEIELSRESIARGADNVPGCYAAFGPDGTCLYVGRARRLLARVMAHFIDQRDGAGSQWRLGGAVEWYFTKPYAPSGSKLKFWLTEDYKGMEKKLILELNPTHNRRTNGDSVPCCNGQRVEIRFDDGGSKFGTIIGETRDKACWRVVIDGNSKYSTEAYHKSFCKLCDPKPEGGNL